MKPIDPKMAARVWERVQAPASPGADPSRLLPLIREEWLDALTLQHLAQKLPAAGGLAAQSQAHVSCLKGMYRMLTGSVPKISPPTLKQEPAHALLRGSFQRQAQLLSQYEARQADPQFGPVFRRLAAETQLQGCRVLELLGTVPK